MTITRAHLTDSIHNRLDLPKAKSAGLVESVFEIMKNTLENGEDILISGFGKFCVKGKRDRRGRNPWTGEDMVLGSRRIVTLYMFRCLEGQTQRQEKVRRWKVQVSLIRENTCGSGCKRAPLPF